MADVRPNLILFAKAPVPGQVKTRLIPHCGARQAAEIAAGMVRRTVDKAVAHWPGPVSLCVTPDAGHPLFVELQERHGIGLSVQAGEDLGARMHHALVAGIARHGAAAVMGCDLPHLPPAVLVDAGDHLCRGEPVIGPSRDGGYYLIGLAAAAADLFRDIAWSTDRVLTQTRERAGGLGLRLTELPAMNDIDTWEDLVAAGLGGMTD